MCTVTFIPLRHKIYLTSNRDEKHWRTDAVPPAVYPGESGNLLFPRDGDAGGTWIAAHENGNVIVFLNGGLTAHTPSPPYRKSRGLILLDLIDAVTPYNSFLAVNLNNIEPFTAIMWDDGHLFECRWGGTQKHTRQLDETRPHIWSSVTLYDEDIIKKRVSWFDQWRQLHKVPSLENILHFHQFTGDGDSNNDLRMNRNGKVFTVSVTSLVLSDKLAAMHYLDLKGGQRSTAELPIEKTTVGRQ